MFELALVKYTFIQGHLPIAPPRLDSSKGPARKISKIFAIFWIFPVHGKNGLRWPQIGPGGFFPTNPDLADILGRTDFNFENFYFFHFLDPKILDFQVPKSMATWQVAINYGHLTIGYWSIGQTSTINYQGTTLMQGAGAEGIGRIAH